MNLHFAAYQQLCRSPVSEKLFGVAGVFISYDVVADDSDNREPEAADRRKDSIGAGVRGQVNTKRGEQL